MRVWIKEDDVPGLAMTRSFGDRVAATVGTTSIPEIKEYDFKEEEVIDDITMILVFFE